MAIRNGSFKAEVWAVLVNGYLLMRALQFCIFANLCIPKLKLQKKKSRTYLLVHNGMRLMTIAAYKDLAKKSDTDFVYDVLPGKHTSIPVLAPKYWHTKNKKRKKQKQNAISNDSETSKTKLPSLHQPRGVTKQSKSHINLFKNTGIIYPKKSENVSDCYV